MVGICVSGHTFLPNHEVFIPKYQLDPLEMAMSVVNPNDAAYRTVYFENIEPTPILYEIDDVSGLVMASAVVHFCVLLRSPKVAR